MKVKIAFWAILVASLFIVVVARAHDPSRPDLDGWYMKLKSKQGVPCCDISDGHAVAPEDWKTEGGHYKVLLNDVWETVPDEAVLDQPNLAQRTIVWKVRTWDGTMKIVCFMPGPET